MLFLWYSKSGGHGNCSSTVCETYTCEHMSGDTSVGCHRKYYISALVKRRSEGEWVEVGNVVVLVNALPYNNLLAPLQQGHNLLQSWSPSAYRWGDQDLPYSSPTLRKNWPYFGQRQSKISLSTTCGIKVETSSFFVVVWWHGHLACIHHIVGAWEMMEQLIAHIGHVPDARLWPLAPKALLQCWEGWHVLSLVKILHPFAGACGFS